MGAITPPDTTAIVTKSHKLLEVAESLIISNADEAQEAADLVREAKRYVADTVRAYEPLKAATNRAHKEACALEKADCAVAKEVIKIVSPKLLEYEREEGRKAREKEAALREAARKQEEERRLQQAVDLDRAGKTEAAEQVLAMPVEAPPVVLPAAPKPTGVTFAEKWTYRVTEESLIPRRYLTVDAKALASLARSMKGKASVPGVEFYNEGSVRAAKG
jgi:hypothetical protein